MAGGVILEKTRWREIHGAEAGLVGVVCAPVPGDGDVSYDFQQPQTP